jgi:hypothetical protein
MSTSESIAKQSVTKALNALQTCGDVLWHTRLQSGMFSVDGSFCHASEKGTFDLVALFKGVDNGLNLAFIEVKRDDRPPELNDNQKAFKDKYYGKHPSIHFWLVQSGDDVNRLVLAHCYNRVTAVEFEP